MLIHGVVVARRWLRRGLTVAAMMLLLGGFGLRSAQAVSVIGLGVEGTATPILGGFQYSYNIVANFAVPGNIQPQPIFPITPTDLTIPFFDPQATTILPGTISAPPGWTSEYVPATALNWPYSAAGDPNAGSYGAPAADFEDATFVLHFHNTEALPNQLDGQLQTQSDGFAVLAGPFQFRSLYGPLEGPVLLAGIGNTSIQAFDPPLVSSPNAPQAVPEPVTAGLSLLALAALGLAATRRRG